MNVFLFSGVILIFAVISPLEGAAFSSNFSAWSANNKNNNDNKALSGSERFSRALISQFDSFKREHPIQARILALVSDLLMRPASVHSLLKNSEGEKVTPQAEERIMGVKMGDEGTARGEETLLPAESSYQPRYSSYTNVRRSGRFMFPDEYEEKVRRFEAEQERTLGRSSFNNYHIVNNQVRLGRVEAVPKPEVDAGVPFIPRGGVRSGRKFEPSVADGSSSTSTSYSSMSDGNEGQNPDNFMANKNVGNEFENWRKFGVLPQEQPPRPYSERPYSSVGEVPQMKSLDDEEKVSDSEWNPSTTDSFTKPTNPFEYMGSPLQFPRPISNNPVPVLRPMYSSVVEGYNSNNNRISRQGKSLNFDVDSQDSEWQLLGTSGQGGETTSREFIPSPPVGVGTVQIQPASAFSSVEASPKEVPRISKVMRPSTIKSQPLIVKDARDGRSLKEIEVQGVKIIVGAKTPSFPKDIYVRSNYVRSLAPPSSSSSSEKSANVDVSVGSSITTL